MAMLKPKKVISQIILVKYLKLEKAHKEYEILKAELVDQLKDNYTVEPGKIIAAIKNDPRRNVAWKEEFIKVTSLERAEEIINSAPKTPVYKLIVVNSSDPVI